MKRRAWLLGPLFVLAAAASVSAEPLRVFMTGGAPHYASDGTITLWANSPQARVSLDNQSSGSFSSVNVLFQNLIAGTYMATPEGVVKGSSREGGSLAAHLTLPAHDRQEWILHPNKTGAYQFAVVGDTENAESGQRTYGQLARDMAANRTLFAIHLGNAVSKGNPQQLQVFQDQLRALPFPTFVLPGTSDLQGPGKAAWPRLFGSLPLAFHIDRDLFCLVSNTSGTLGKSGRAWLAGVLQRGDDEHVRHKFVFMHLPPVDPRPGINAGMSNRQEVRYLLGLFQKHHVSAVFGGHIHMYARERRRDVTYVTTGGGGHRLDVRPKAGGFYHFVKVDVNGNAVGLKPIQ